MSDLDWVAGSPSSSVSWMTTEVPERSRDWPTFVDRVDATLTDVVRLEGGSCG